MNMKEVSQVKFVGDYKTQFNELVDDLFDDWKEEGVEHRLVLSDLLVERYFEDTSETPAPYALDRLAHLISWDHMEGDTRKNKSAMEEYPILTETQLKRKEGLNSRKTSYGVTNKEVPLNHAFNVGTDGREYTTPVRRYD